MQSNPFLERIFASLESEESTGATSNWRSRIDAAAPNEKQAVICQAVREAVGSVLRVKPDSLRDDQPLTDLGLDSLMGVEIETSLEAAVGVALPPTSLMRARTIGQIAALIAGHLGGATTAAATEPTPVAVTSEAANAVDLDAISDEEIARLLGSESESDSEEKAEAIEGANR
jgi:acyl carrier protein